jgi:hypothetical protein
MLTGPSLTIEADMPVLVDVQNFGKLLRLLIAVTCSKHSPTTIGRVRRLDEAPAVMRLNTAVAVGTDGTTWLQCFRET